MFFRKYTLVLIYIVFSTTVTPCRLLQRVYYRRTSRCSRMCQHWRREIREVGVERLAMIMRALFERCARCEVVVFRRTREIVRVFIYFFSAYSGDLRESGI